MSQYLMLMKEYSEYNRFKGESNKFFTVYIRFIVATMNEVIIFMIIASYDFGTELSFGLVINFSSALIISQLSTLVVITGRIKKFDTYFN